MSTHGINTCEDAEMADCDGEKVVTMMDVLKEQEDFEDNANAVLGASDDKNCTYSKGYIKRQAIYACMTCCADAKNDPTKWAGVCLACSLTCHDNHELIELYTKRNFRCDCGNPKFNAHPCQFTPGKTEPNIDNIYNQNFGGVYCVCHRPYPDPDADTQGDMIQCIICEDWLHSNHLDAVVPPNDQYAEMICKACMDKNEFLHDYSELAVNKENMDVDILNTSSEMETMAINNEISDTELVDIANISSDDIISKQTENNDNVEKVIEEPVTNNKQQNEAEPVIEENHKHFPNDLNKEQQNNTEKLDCGISCDNQNEGNAVELQNDKNNAAENDDQVDVKMTADVDEKTDDNLREKEIPKNGEEPKSLEKPDNRSQEQVEEDLLLADPTENDTNQKNNDVASPSTFQSNNDVSAKQSNSNAMDTSEPDNENLVQKTEDFISHAAESEKTATADQLEKETAAEHSENKTSGEPSENVTGAEQSENVIAAEQLENITAKEKSENVTAAEQAENVTAAEQAENVTAAEHSENKTAGEHSENVTGAEESENVIAAKQAENVTITEQAAQEPKTKEFPVTNHSSSVEKETAGNSEDLEKECQESETNAVQSETATDIKQADVTSKIEAANSVCSKESEQAKDVTEELQQPVINAKDDHADVSMDENKCEGVDNNVFDKDKPSDTTKDENNTDNLINNDIPNDDCDKEVPVNKAGTDILKRKLSTDTDNVEVKKPKLEEHKCIRPKGVKKVYHGATFWPSNFRHKLCTCNECITMYKDLSVLFLIDPEDTVTAYETLGKDITDGKPASQYEKGMAALSSLGRVQQINALTEYAKLRDKLLDFLKTFKERKATVKEEDIRAFFAGMKPVREPDGVYFCR